MLEKIYFDTMHTALLLVNKSMSFDKSFKGDFNLKNGLINRNKSTDLNYVYTGLQIIKPELFLDIKGLVAQ